MSYCDNCPMPWCNPNCSHRNDEDDDDTSLLFSSTGELDIAGYTRRIDAAQTKLNRILEVESIFVDIAGKYDDYEDIIAAIRSLNSEGELTDEEYDYITANWDDMLKANGLI